MLNLFAVVVERDFVTIEWASFIAGLASNPILVVVTLLNIGVIVVNGATDAPNAIATVVSTRAMKPKPAVSAAVPAGVFGRLVAAGKRLMQIIERSKGRANKDLTKFTNQINALCDKWE